MAITDRAKYNIQNETQRIFNKCLGWMQHSTFRDSESKPLNGDRIYKVLFGSEKPCVFTRILSPSAQEMEELFNLKGKMYPQAAQMNPQPGQICLNIREKAQDYSGSEYVSLYLPLTHRVIMAPPLIREFGYSGNTSQINLNFGSREGASQQLTHSHFLPILLEHYGEEFLHSINNIVAFHDSLHKVHESLTSYVNQCKSLAGVYNKLPILNTLVPNKDLEHVHYTRKTPDPYSGLVQNLNTLCSMNQARKQAQQTSGTKEQE